MTSDQLADPLGDEAYMEVMTQGKKQASTLRERLEKAETQLKGIQGVLLKKGVKNEKLLSQFNDYTKEVAESRTELLKYAPRVVESAALTAKLNVQIAALSAVTNKKQSLSDSSAIEDAVAEEATLSNAVRQTKSQIARLIGSNVDEGSACDESSQCGSKQSCIEHVCSIVQSGATCKVDGDCGNGQNCISNKCSLTFDGAPCASDKFDCGNNMVCVMGMCSALFPRFGSTVAEDSPCVSAGDCGLHQDCVADKCLFVGHGIPCKHTNQCGNSAVCTSVSSTQVNGTENVELKNTCESVPEGTYCTSQEACGKNMYCHDNTCINAFGLIRGSNVALNAPCDSGYDCGVNQYCKDSKCVIRSTHDKCKPAWPPGNGQICVSGSWRAIAEGTKCTATEECGARQVNEVTFCLFWRDVVE
jgi:hypothetical protein